MDGVTCVFVNKCCKCGKRIKGEFVPQYTRSLCNDCYNKITLKYLKEELKRAENFCNYSGDPKINEIQKRNNEERIKYLKSEITKCNNR